MITFVHALWGDEIVASWPKILRDIQWGWSWRNKPKEFKRLVFAYGKQNWRYLRQFGFKPMLLSQQPVVDFLGVGNRTADGRGTRGVFNYGISMWEHKRHAIQTAFEQGCDEVLWLDWDTREKSKDYSVLEQLKDGPEFQGRLRWYKNVSSAGGLREVYHGGCYYLRSPRIMEEVARIRPQAKYVTDEVLITWAINNFYFNSNQATPKQHLDMKFDNPILYGTRMNANKDDTVPLFFEGNMDKSQPFSTRTTNPPDQFQYYNPKLDKQDGN